MVEAASCNYNCDITNASTVCQKWHDQSLHSPLCHNALYEAIPKIISAIAYRNSHTSLLCRWMPAASVGRFIGLPSIWQLVLPSFNWDLDSCTTCFLPGQKRGHMPYAAAPTIPCKGIWCCQHKLWRIQFRMVIAVSNCLSQMIVVYWTSQDRSQFGIKHCSRMPQ